MTEPHGADVEGVVHSSTPSSLPTCFTPTAKLSKQSSIKSATKAATAIYAKVKARAAEGAAPVTATHVAEFVKSLTGHVIRATKITKIVRDGRAGITPYKHAKKRKAGEVDSSEPIPCDGICAAGSIGKARTYFAKILRKASVFVAGPDFEARVHSLTSGLLPGYPEPENIYIQLSHYRQRRYLSPSSLSLRLLH